MPASRHLFGPSSGGTAPRPTGDGEHLVAFLQALGRSGRDVWAEARQAEPAVPPPPGAPRHEMLARGSELYRRLCSQCHGIAGDGRGDAAPLLRIPPRDFTAGRFRFRSAPLGSPPVGADLFRSLTLGSGTGAAMPSFRHLPAEDRWALVLRILEFSRHGGAAGLAPGQEPGSPPGRRLPGSAEAGLRLWGDLGCASCHDGEGRDPIPAGQADHGDGGGVPPGDLGHACGLRGGASPGALARAVRHGVGETMPSYDEALTSLDLADLVDYLLSRQQAAADGTGAATGPGTRSRR
jgi:mono/diheme cytochrome c family protein